MEDTPAAGAREPAVVEHLDHLFHEQITLVKTIVSDNAVLQNHVEELVLDIAGWKAAFKSADDERKLLIKKVSTLERSIDSLKDDNPLLLCLIDGDGNIFSEVLIRQGRAGGRQAAMLLTKGITDHMTAGVDAELSGRGQVWLTVYCNKTGLLNTLTRHEICTTEQFEGFVLGFNQASPLFSIVDVGNMKEAADAKIKECLRVFTRFPQTSRVFFGGGHDNGYTSTLNYLENEGLLGKIILLNGYKDLAMDVRGLNLPQLEIRGVFMQDKLSANTYASPTKAMQRLQFEDSDKYRLSRQSPPMKLSSPPKLSKKAEDKSNSRLCIYHYVGGRCRHGTKCNFRHDYVPSADDLDQLQMDAKNLPCFQLNSNRTCTEGNACAWGHFCPQGTHCKFYKNGVCKFKGLTMHDSSGSRHDDNGGNRGLRSPAPSGNYTAPAAYGTSLLMRLTSPGAVHPELLSASGSPRKRSANLTFDLPPVPFLDG